jgi:hypothetical protein
LTNHNAGVEGFDISKFKVLIAQSKRFWAMMGEEQSLMPLFGQSMFC